MKRKVVLFIFLICALFSYAQSVSYSYRPLAAEGCNVKYTANWQEGKPYLIVSIRSDRMKFVAQPVILLKTSDGDTIRLEGTPLDVSSQSYGIASGNIIIPIQEFNATAQFSITTEQIELLSKGISKVRISLVPMNHERTFSKDKIGKKLYKAFQKTKTVEDNF